MTETPTFAGVAESIRTAASLLAATSDTPRLDAELLMAHALGIERQALLLDPGRYEVPDRYANLVATRMAHTPMAYILGYRDFWTIRIEVGPGVLIPRPDSETLVEACLDFARHERAQGWPSRILDLGTGPGTLLLAVLSEQHLEPAARQPRVPNLDALSAREREVLALIAQGASNAAIAERLSLSDHTVKRHVANILLKLDLPTRAAAAALVGRPSSS